MYQPALAHQVTAGLGAFSPTEAKQGGSPAIGGNEVRPWFTCYEPLMEIMLHAYLLHTCREPRSTSCMFFGDLASVSLHEPRLVDSVDLLWCPWPSIPTLASSSSTRLPKVHLVFCCASVSISYWIRPLREMLCKAYLCKCSRISLVVSGLALSQVMPVIGWPFKEWITKMWSIYTMGYYSAFKNKGIIQFAGKWVKRENILSDQGRYSWYTLTYKCILARKYRISMQQSTDSEELSNKESAEQDDWISLRRGNKTDIRGRTSNGETGTSVWSYVFLIHIYPSLMYLLHFLWLSFIVFIWIYFC